MSTPENPDAGQGPVLLDIGGDVGALVVRMPPETEGLEVEIRPAGTWHASTRPQDGQHAHHHPHVAVVGRPGRESVAFTLVYPSVVAGDHDLVPLPDGQVVMTVTVEGGQVARATWPANWPGTA